MKQRIEIKTSPRLDIDILELQDATICCANIATKLVKECNGDIGLIRKKASEMDFKNMPENFDPVDEIVWAAGYLIKFEENK